MIHSKDSKSYDFVSKFLISKRNCTYFFHIEIGTVCAPWQPALDLKHANFSFLFHF